MLIINYYYYFYENAKFKKCEYKVNCGCLILMALQDVDLLGSNANFFFLLKKDH